VHRTELEGSVGVLERLATTVPGKGVVRL
jgi:hypothetical protein